MNDLLILITATVFFLYLDDMKNEKSANSGCNCGCGRDRKSNNYNGLLGDGETDPLGVVDGTDSFVLNSYF